MTEHAPGCMPPLTLARARQQDPWSGIRVDVLPCRFLRFGPATAADDAPPMAPSAPPLDPSEASVAEGSNPDAVPRRSSQRGVADGAPSALRESAQTRLAAAPPGVRCPPSLSVPHILRSHLDEHAWFGCIAIAEAEGTARVPVKPDAMNGAGAGGIRAWPKLGREAPSPRAQRSCTTWLSAPRMPWPWRTWQRRAQVPRCSPALAHLPAACALCDVNCSARCGAHTGSRPSTAGHTATPSNVRDCGAAAGCRNGQGALPAGGGPDGGVVAGVPGPEPLQLAGARALPKSGAADSQRRTGYFSLCFSAMLGTQRCHWTCSCSSQSVLWYRSFWVSYTLRSAPS